MLIIGDSHAEQYYPRVEALRKASAGPFPRVLFATSGGCPPVPGFNRADPSYACDRFIQYALSLAANPAVETVVFAAYWEAYLEFPGESAPRHRFAGAGHYTPTDLVQTRLRLVRPPVR